VRGHQKLNPGEVVLEPKTDFSLPLGVQMRVNFVDHDHATFDDAQPSVIVALRESVDTVGVEQVSEDVSQQCQRGPIPIAHVVPGQLQAVAILQPQAIGIHPVHGNLVGHQLVTQNFDEQFQMRRLDWPVFQFFVIEAAQPLIHLGKGCRFLKHGDETLGTGTDHQPHGIRRRTKHTAERTITA